MKARSYARNIASYPLPPPDFPTYPNLAGQNAAYIELAIKAYKSGQRSGGQAAIMQGMAAPLSDADISNLAAYFSSL